MFVRLRQTNFKIGANGRYADLARLGLTQPYLRHEAPTHCPGNRAKKLSTSALKRAASRLEFFSSSHIATLQTRTFTLYHIYSPPHHSNLLTHLHKNTSSPLDLSASTPVQPLIASDLGTS